MAPSLAVAHSSHSPFASAVCSPLASDSSWDVAPTRTSRWKPAASENTSERSVTSPAPTAAERPSGCRACPAEGDDSSRGGGGGADRPTGVDQRRLEKGHVTVSVCDSSLADDPAGR